jgi:hypothetical protein
VECTQNSQTIKYDALPNISNRNVELSRRIQAACSYKDRPTELPGDHTAVLQFEHLAS